MNRLASIATILVCTVAVVRGAPPNPLIGKWKLAPAGANASRLYTYCATSMVFTGTTQTLTYAGKSGTENITYNAVQTAVYPTTVYVMGTAGTHTTYLFSSKDKVVLDTAAFCTYRRE